MKKSRASVCQRQNKALCEEHMGKYPVIFLTLKNVDGLENNEQKCSCGHTHAHSPQKIEGGNTHERA